MDGERRPLADPGQVQRVVEPVALCRVVRPPDPDDPQVDHPLLAGATRQRQLVADLDAEPWLRARRHRHLERLGAGCRPRAIDDGRVLHQAIRGGKHRHVGLGRTGDGAFQVKGAGSDRPRQLAIGPAQDPPRLAGDRLIDGRELLRVDAHLDIDAGGGGRLGSEGLPEATQRDGIAVEDADRQQRRRAHDHEPGGDHDEPVGDASLQDNAQRGQQALEHPDPPYEPTRPAVADRFTMLGTDAPRKEDRSARYPVPGPLAQRLEQGTFNPRVVGSNPTRPSLTTEAGRTGRLAASRSSMPLRSSGRPQSRRRSARRLRVSAYDR